MRARPFLPLMKICSRYTGLCQPQCNVVFWHWWDWAGPVLCASGEEKPPQALPLGFSFTQPLQFCCVWANGPAGRSPGLEFCVGGCIFCPKPFGSQLVRDPGNREPQTSQPHALGLIGPLPHVCARGCLSNTHHCFSFVLLKDLQKMDGRGSVP